MVSIVSVVIPVSLANLADLVSEPTGQSSHYSMCAVGPT